MVKQTNKYKDFELKMENKYSTQKAVVVHIVRLSRLLGMIKKGGEKRLKKIIGSTMITKY